MTVKILLKRQFPKEKGAALKELIEQMRSSATGQPGHISGETLRRVDRPGEFLLSGVFRNPKQKIFQGSGLNFSR